MTQECAWCMHHYCDVYVLKGKLAQNIINSIIGSDILWDHEISFTNGETMYVYHDFL